MAEAASSRTALVRRARRINAELARLYPDARIELNFTTPLELLVAAILSARSTDRLVNQVTPVLFGRYGTAADYAAADQAELERLIEPTGFFRAKAKTLISLGQALCDRFDGAVPDTLEELLTLVSLLLTLGMCAISRRVTNAEQSGKIAYWSVS